MPFPPFRRNRARRTIAALYGTIVAQARDPIFYRDLGVADSLEGRLDLLMLHVILVLRRLERGGPALAALDQELFAHFCRDMDGNLREMGVGDLAVPKRMQRIGEAFYGRRAVYDRALAESAGAGLAATLQRNVFGGAAGGSAAARVLALYVRQAEAQLAAQDAAALAAGTLAFPDPGRFVPVAVELDHDEQQ
jgi:cytochrome b pre-mRNA-processing protein 3